MMAEPKAKALFLSNEKFLDDSFPEGGVKFCTDEYIALIKESFELILFPVVYSESLMLKIRKKLGLSAYDEYDVQSYRSKVLAAIELNNINHVFLNLSSTAPFAKMLKAALPHIKLILCSHGNESGDFLHEANRPRHQKGLTQKTFRYTLGKMLSREYEQRKYIDLVLTVSEVEENIEKWLGAKNVYLVPRTIAENFGSRNPVSGRVGFVSDLSHAPNFDGISKVCESLATMNTDGLELRLAGSGKERGTMLEKHYPFVKYLGHLPENELQNELGSWAFALNPVFYYSRGVSTKLGKLLSAGVPAITTEIGMRGYKWERGSLPVCKNENDMALFIGKNADDPICYNRFQNEVSLIQQSAPKLKDIMHEIADIL